MRRVGALQVDPSIIGMQDNRPIAVSPRHHVLLAAELAILVDRPPARDFVVRTIATHKSGGTPLMTAELVIAGQATREQHPLAREYPLHFKKTYYPGRLRCDPEREFDMQARASAVIGVPPPIGWSRGVFRACLLPGQPYHRLSPFGTDPEESNVSAALDLGLASAAGLWRLLEDAFERLRRLHAAGVIHGDVQLQNLIACPAPLEALLVDFENARERGGLSATDWDAACGREFLPLLREAVYVQCALGRQPGALADVAWDRCDELFRDPKRFRRAIHERAGLDA